MNQTGDPRAAFIDAAVGHGPIEHAEAILAAHPEIAASDIHTAAILGDEVAIKKFLALDPSSATAKSGPRGWDALTHLCFSKYLRLDHARSGAFLRSATVLLDAGADPNTGFFHQDHQPQPTLESVLYGAAGVAHHPELTRLLLERGADPNDGEVAYHCPETLDNRALKVLVDSGRLTPESLLTMVRRKLDWHDYDGVAWLLARAGPSQVRHWGERLLRHALARGNPLPFFELLLDHGAAPAPSTETPAPPAEPSPAASAIAARLARVDVLDHGAAPVPSTETPAPPAEPSPAAFAIAARLARVDVLDLFDRRGFAVTLHGDDAFLAACARAGQASARRIAADDPAVVERLQTGNPGLLVDFAASGNTAAVRLMLDLGFDIRASRATPPWSAGETALHVAAWRGYATLAKLLIERGAPLEATARSGATPLAVALRALVEQSEWTPNEYSLEIAQTLLDAGARLDSVKLTLAAALCLERTGDARRLLPDASAADRRLALEAAAMNGKVRALAFLIDLGVDLNAYNTTIYSHATPLHNAVCSGSLEAVKLLVGAGAGVETLDAAYQATPLAWAEYFLREAKEKKQYAEIVAYLRAKGQA